jgi:hypothetical protein
MEIREASLILKWSLCNLEGTKVEKVFRKTVKVMNVPLLKRFCEGGVFGWWETVAERVIQFSQPRPQVL